MKTKTLRLTSAGLVGLFLVSVLAAITPPVAAQADKQLAIQCCTFTDDGNLAGNRILPDTGIAKIKVSGKVIVPQLAECIVSITISFTATGPGYATYLMSPATQISTVSGTNQGFTTADKSYEITFNTDLVVTVTRDAPAFQDGSYEVTVNAKGATASTSGGTCTLSDAQPAKAKYTLKNDYLPLVAVNALQLFIKTGQNKKAVFPVEVVNLGNGPTRVKIELTPSGKNKLDSYNAGGELRLESKAGKTAAQNKVTRNIEVQTPHSNGYENSIYSFIGKFSSSYDGAATGTLQTDETSITFNVQVQGVYVPGFDPLSVVAALGVSLLFLGRRMRSG